MTTKQDAKTEPAPAHTGIYAALAAAQAEMGRAVKDASNPHFKSKYADLASVQDACMGALNGHGIAVYQPVVADGERWAVKTVFAHEGGETLECAVPLIIGKNDMQGFGSAVTYARRYGLMCMAGVAPEDDDGNAAAAAAPKHNGQRRQWEPGQHAAPPPPAETPFDGEPPPAETTPDHEAGVASTLSRIHHAKDLDALSELWGRLYGAIKADQRVIDAKDKRKSELTIQAADAQSEVNAP